MPRIATLIAVALASLVLQAAGSAASAEDLTEFSGTWAFTPAGCQDYLNGRIENEARKRGAGLMIIRPTDIEWVTPATCEVSNVQVSGNRRDMDGKCELKGNDFQGRITLTPADSNRISLRVDADVTGRETLTYNRCSKATKWKDE